VIPAPGSRGSLETPREPPKPAVEAGEIETVVFIPVPRVGSGRMSLIHVCLNVADAERAADWYESELGFERSWEFTTPDGDTRNLYVADEDGVEIQLSDTDGEESFEAGTAWDHLAIGVDDVDAAFERIDDHGVVSEPADQPAAGARTAFIEDPDGHVVELVEPLE